MAKSKVKKTEPPHFEFNLGESVCILTSGESGLVKARAQYDHSEDSYYVSYCDNRGVAQMAWWPASELKLA